MNICQNDLCNKEFTPSRNSTGKYCSQSCAARVNNRIYPKRIRVSGITHCLYCKKKLKDNQGKYCSSKHQWKYTQLQRINEWLSGELNAASKDGSLSKTIRNYLLEINDNKCSRPGCRWGIPNPYTGKVILTIDHKDGDIYNGFFNNIELLCWNCHSLTATFGSLNKGNGKRNTVGMRQYGLAVTKDPDISTSTSTE